MERDEHDDEGERDLDDGASTLRRVGSGHERGAESGGKREALWMETAPPGPVSHLPASPAGDGGGVPTGMPPRTWTAVGADGTPPTAGGAM